MKKKLAKLISLIFFPLYILILLTKPFLNIKFGNLYSSRIGHLCELHQFIILKNNFYKKEIWFISFSKPIINLQLYNIIKKQKNYIEIPSIIGKYFEIFLNIINDKTINLDLSGKNYFENFNRYLNIKDFLQPVKKNIEFNKLLNDYLHLNRVICIHNRDNSLQKSQNLKLEYHSFRNSNPKYLNKMINNLVSNNFFVVRMGSSSDEKLQFKSKYFFDYTRSKENNNLNDLILLSNCRYYIGSDSGLSNVPRIFGKESFYINFPINHVDKLTFFHSGIFLPKKIFEKKTQKLLSLREIFDRKLYKINLNDLFLKEGVYFYENSDEEIYNFSMNLINLNKNDILITYEQTKFDELLKNFCNKNNLKTGSFRPKIDADFIKENNYLLE